MPQWQGAFVAAEEQLDLAAEETGLEDPTSPSSLSALASVFQHRAKCRFEHALAERPRPTAPGGGEAVGGGARGCGGRCTCGSGSASPPRTSSSPVGRRCAAWNGVM
ncbi:hypothetical protein [Brachybacterium sp. GPGPB12]|uniref:hypothetical protein n=1 Tax=Brachybacterium sp. GPGPB12 TaxID=3023517 RepID=UPI0031345EAE